jgi:hypothetical protein
MFPYWIEKENKQQEDKRIPLHIHAPPPASYYENEESIEDESIRGVEVIDLSIDLSID